MSSLNPIIYLSGDFDLRLSMSECISNKQISYLPEQTITAILKNLLDEIFCRSSNTFFDQKILPFLDAETWFDAEKDMG
jgi:hypothetical protein